MKRSVCICILWLLAAELVSSPPQHRAVCPGIPVTFICVLADAWAHATINGQIPSYFGALVKSVPSLNGTVYLSVTLTPEANKIYTVVCHTKDGIENSTTIASQGHLSGPTNFTIVCTLYHCRVQWSPPTDALDPAVLNYHVLITDAHNGSVRYEGNVTGNYVEFNASDAFKVEITPLCGTLGDVNTTVKNYMAPSSSSSSSSSSSPSSDAVHPTSEIVNYTQTNIQRNSPSYMYIIYIVIGIVAGGILCAPVIEIVAGGVLCTPVIGIVAGGVLCALAIGIAVAKHVCVGLGIIFVGLKKLCCTKKVLQPVDHLGRSEFVSIPPHALPDTCSNKYVPSVEPSKSLEDTSDSMQGVEMHIQTGQVENKQDSLASQIAVPFSRAPQSPLQQQYNRSQISKTIDDQDHTNVEADAFHTVQALVGSAGLATEGEHVSDTGGRTLTPEQRMQETQPPMGKAL